MIQIFHQLFPISNQPLLTDPNVLHKLLTQNGDKVTKILKQNSSHFSPDNPNSYENFEKIIKQLNEKQNSLNLKTHAIAKKSYSKDTVLTNVTSNFPDQESESEMIENKNSYSRDEILELQRLEFETQKQKQKPVPNRSKKIDFQSYYEKFYPKSRENSVEPIRKTDAKTYKNFNLDDRHESKRKKKSIELTHKDSINLAKMHHQISSKKVENIKPTMNLHVGSGQISATTEYGHKIYTPTLKTQSKPAQKNQMNALRENFWRSRPENRLSKSILNQPRSRSAAAGNYNYNHSDNGLYRNSNQRINLNLSNTVYPGTNGMTHNVRNSAGKTRHPRASFRSAAPVSTRSEISSVAQSPARLTLKSKQPSFEQVAIVFSDLDG